MQRVLSTTNSVSTRVRESKLEAGDRVLVRNVGIWKHKIANRWSQTVYRVIKQVKDLPVYVIVPCDSDGPERVLHRDLLLPCGFLHSTVAEQEQMRKCRPSRESKASPSNSVAGADNSDNKETDQNLSESDEEGDIDYYYSGCAPTTDRNGIRNCGGQLQP